MREGGEAMVYFNFISIIFLSNSTSHYFSQHKWIHDERMEKEFWPQNVCLSNPIPLSSILFLFINFFRARLFTIFHFNLWLSFLLWPNINAFLMTGKNHQNVPPKEPLPSTRLTLNSFPAFRSSIPKSWMRPFHQPEVYRHFLTLLFLNHYIQMVIHYSRELLLPPSTRNFLTAVN